MVVPSKNQQNELWIFLVVTWWIGSLVAWIAVWTTSTTSTANDSLLTASGLLLFGVSAALRLPVVTTTQPTTSLEDHFVWLVTASANVNWLGYLCLSSQSYAAVLPAGVVGILVEYWLWSELCRRDCLAGLRGFISAFSTSLVKNAISSGNDALRVENPTEAVTNQLAVSSAAASTVKSESATSNFVSSNKTDSSSIQLDVVEAAEGTVLRTTEDGIDLAGFRYMAGEVQVAWEESQRTQTVVLGFVPAFEGSPEVELELDCEECSAQIQNCTPNGLRIQLKRSLGSNTQGSSTPGSHSQLTNLSWYAKESNCSESSNGESDGDSAESKPQTLA